MLSSRAGAHRFRLARAGAAVLGVLALSAGAAGTWPASAAVQARQARQARPSRPRGPRSIEPAPAVPAGARPAGALSPAAQISGDVVLKPRDNAAIQRFIARVTNQNSPSFRDYLKPGTYASRFGPAKSTVSKAVSLLRSDGLHVTAVASDDLLIHFRGSAAAIEHAFGTGLESYRLRSGFVGRATTSAVRLPGSIAGSVAAVLGLNNLVRTQPEGIVRAPAKDKGKIRPAKAASFAHPAGSPKPCKAATAAATAFGGLTDDQIAHAYGAFGLYGAGDFGAGQHIALYELEPFARSDVKAFDTCFFGAAAAKQMLSRLHTVSVDGGQPAGPGSGESILDVEDLSALAPQATIDVYTGPSPGSDGTIYDPVDEYAAMINADQDQVISTSWGLCEQAIEAGQPGLQVAENLLFEQAAAQGQSVFSAAGDNGSDDCNTFETTTPVSGQNPLSLDDPASQPYVVSVGGTTINDASAQPPLEQVWNDGAAGGGGGGGISQSWAMPSWQREATVPGIARPGSAVYADAAQVEKTFKYPPNFCQATLAGATAATPCRTAPDVSAQADEFTGAITIYQAAFGGWTTIGGTSSATPIWAAMLALVNASSTCTANPATKHGVGFASPLLYEVASSPAAYSASFNDIRLGNNDIYGLDDGRVFAASKGYDLASGLGSPRLTGPSGSAGLAFHLCGLGASAARPAVSALSPAEGSVNGGQTLTITGTGFESHGTPDVGGVQIGAAELSGSEFQVVNATTITATLPSGLAALPPLAPSPQDGAGPAQVIVTLKDDVSSRPGSASTFEYVDTGIKNADFPSVTGVVPYAGAEVKPKPVAILGSDFNTATSVTFGGVPATTWKIDNDNRITATPPAFSGSTQCAPLPHSGVYAGENATNDICQVQVRVGNANFTSRTSEIRPPDEGAVTLNALGVLVPPANCGCEIEQAPTEYDYAPAPVITSVSTSSGAANLASEQGGSVITVKGKGLDPLTINWADFGPANQEFSQNTDFVFMTGTEMQIVAPGKGLTEGLSAVPFSVNSLAGQSSPAKVFYSGVPKVTGVITTENHATLNGIHGAADTGGTQLAISGNGFARQLTLVEFNDTSSPFSAGTQYSYAVVGNTKVNTETVQQNPALVNVQLCTTSGCSKAVKADRLYLYPPGNPHVTSVSPASGPAAGGTKVTVAGTSLGCAVGVFFGKVKARSFKPTAALLDCGSTVTLSATSPKGKAGTKVAVRVETVESFFTRSGHGTTTADFRYK